MKYFSRFNVANTTCCSMIRLCKCLKYGAFWIGHAPIMFSLNDLDIAMKKLNQVKGFDHVHSLHLMYAKSIFRKFYVNL